MLRSFATVCVLASTLGSAGLVGAPVASAQEIRDLEPRIVNAPGYFTSVLPGERSVQATVLGTVRAPGLYTVSDGTDMGELLALAGGPTLAPLSTEIERTVTVRLYRGTGEREVVYERTFDGFAADASAYPRLVDGDLLEVTTVDRRLRTFRDTLTYVGAGASVVIALAQLINLIR